MEQLVIDILKLLELEPTDTRKWDVRRYIEIGESFEAAPIVIANSICKWYTIWHNSKGDMVDLIANQIDEYQKQKAV